MPRHLYFGTHIRRCSTLPIRYCLYIRVFLLSGVFGSCFFRVFSSSVSVLLVGLSSRPVSQDSGDSEVGDSGCLSSSNATPSSPALARCRRRTDNGRPLLTRVEVSRRQLTTERSKMCFDPVYYL